MRPITIWTSATLATLLIAAAPSLSEDASMHGEKTSPAAAAADADTAEGANPMPKHDEQMKAAPGSDEAQTYVVEQGDTLATIAEAKLGSSDKWKEIARANGIDDPGSLRIGQKLVIPGAGMHGQKSQL